MLIELHLREKQELFEANAALRQVGVLRRACLQSRAGAGGAAGSPS